MGQLDQSLIGTAAVADLLGWSRTKVKREAQAGRLPYEHKVDGQTGAYLFNRTVIEVIAANRRRAEACA